MKKILMSLLFLTSINVYAQDKIAIAFIPITYDDQKVTAVEAKTIQETVLNAIVSAKRFSVVDREKLEELEKEKKLQRSESFMDSKESAKTGVSKGASYLLATNVISIRNSEEKKGWGSAVHLQIKVLDVSTGEILATENISSEFVPIDQAVKDARSEYLSKDDIKALNLKEAQLQEIKSHQEDALMIALQRLGENVKKFTSFNFSMALPIVEWDQKKKKEFVINAGHRLGIYKGQMLDVVKITESTIDGQTVERKQKVASAWVFRVDDDNFSAATILNTTKEYNNVKKQNIKLGVLTR